MEIINVKYSGFGQKFQDISGLDNSLISSNYINSVFGNQNDYVELYIYGEDGDLLETDYNYGDFKPLALTDAANNTYSSVTVDPEKDAKSRGYTRGKVTLQYNFYRLLFNSSVNSNFWIKEISRSRTELKLASQVISDTSIRQGFDSYRAYIGSKNYYPVFYLNFQNNQLIIANNVAYTEDADGAYLLIKLYEPLPEDFDLKSTLWMVDKVAESVSYQVTIDVQTEVVRIQNNLRGPNYNVAINNKTGQGTPYYNYSNLISSPISSSFQKLASWYQDKAISINLDFSNFSNFVHFSSAEKRVENFVEKLRLIESAESNISVQRSIVSGSSTIVSQSVSSEQKFIDNVIKNFDIYEYFLYFQSSSFAWPKSNSTQPYTLYSVTSSQASNFLGSVNTVPTATTASLLFSASYYDSNNKDILRNSIPQYLLDDPANEPFTLFLDMIGQHFDNIWVYYKDVTNRYNATNSPYTGISMDMVADALRGLGLALYTNSNVSNNLYYTLFGINEDGSLLPPTGSEVITKYVTSSLTTLPAEQIQDELYKRLYHNLPYLFKTKGTAQSIKSLISIFGIPEDILTVREFGGNVFNELDGVTDLNSSQEKVYIVTGSNGNVTGSLTISSSLLSPYTTIQYFEGDRRLNNSVIEVGFSPSDVINNNISGGLANLNIDQLIGSPGYVYSSSYTPLVSASNAYFSSYTQRNSVWEYIRLLKFYNNSLFKTIKDFVPARANVSTGIIIKSHMLERNKYARHEPQVTFNEYSQSIEILDISADSGGAISGSTSWSGSVVTPLGLASYFSLQNKELYTGEYSGSNIVVTDGAAMQQGDHISHTTGSINFYNYGAVYQNVTASIRSQNFIDLDYNSNQLVPVNYGAVTYSLNLLNTNAYSAYSNINNPFAQLQDYNYFLQRSINPRYVGSETISALYTTYTTGDRSYGKTAAIDKIKYQYAYLVDIYSASIFLPERSNAQIKYIIDNNENVLDLTKANKNIFEVQNIFRSGETVNISLFDYDESNPYTQLLANDPTLAIYEGGWRYLPILHNINSSSRSQQFFLSSPEKVTVPAGVDPGSQEANKDNYTSSVSYNYNVIQYGNPEDDLRTYQQYVQISSSFGPVTNNVTLTVGYYYGIGPETCNVFKTTTDVIIYSGSEGVSLLVGSWGPLSDTTAPGNYSGNLVETCLGLEIVSVNVSSAGGGSSSTAEFTYYTPTFTTSNSCIYAISSSNELVFDSKLTYYYYSANAPITFSSSADSTWSGSGLSLVVTPFELSVGDKVSFYNSQSLGWSEISEYTIKNIRAYPNIPTSYTSSVLLAEVVEPINYALFSSGSGIPSESITGSPYRNCRYIVWKHVPDETNVILRYNAKDQNLVENGILFPQYIDQTVRENAGNVIKALKQQNLISDLNASTDTVLTL